jgi:hypothetical protein
MLLRRLPKLVRSFSSRLTRGSLLGTAFRPGLKKTVAFGIFGLLAPIGFLIGGVWGSLFGQLGPTVWWIFWSQSVMLFLNSIQCGSHPDHLPQGHGICGHDRCELVNYT